MIKPGLTALILFTSLSSYGANCSYSVLEDFKDGTQNTVYTLEGYALVAEKADVMARMGDPENTPYYPDINKVTECVASYRLFAAHKNCEDILDAAELFATRVGLGIITGIIPVNATYPLGGTVPDEVMNFYRAFQGRPLTGDFYSNYATDGYGTYFRKMAEVAEACLEDRDVPVHKIPDFSPSESDGFAIVDVFKNNQLSCSFMATIVDSKIKIKVPKPFHRCVKESDAMITRIEQKDASGLLVTKTVASAPDSYISTDENATYRVVASSDNNEGVSNIISALDAGSNISLADAVQVRIQDIPFDDVASLDPAILKIVGICESQIDPNNYAADEAAFLADWFVATDDVSATTGSNGGYYRALYYHQKNNAEIYPLLKQLHQDVRDGVITNANLWNWAGNAFAVCYFNYPALWTPVYVRDFIVDGVLDRADLIDPDWMAWIDPGWLGD